MIAGVIAVEGGYVNDRADPGGETNMGVTKRVAVQNGYSGPMRTLPREVAAGIYYRQYIVGPGYEPLIPIDAAVTEELFDTTVNMGAPRPSRWFQQSINILCNVSLAEDAHVGASTVAAYAACQQRVGATRLCLATLEQLDARQQAEYARLVRVNPRLRRFYKGWVANRIGNVDRRKCSVRAVSRLAAGGTSGKPIRHSGVLRSMASYGEILPPTRFKRDTAAIVIFGHQNVITATCQQDGSRDAPAPIACAWFQDNGTPFIAVPNPCAIADRDLYAAILCHELGHLNGWPATHGD